MSDLLGPQGGARPKAYTASLGRDPARAGALHDQGSLEVGDAGKHGQYHSPGGRRGIGPWLGEGPQARTGLLDPLSDLQQVTGGAGKPV